MNDNKNQEKIKILPKPKNNCCYLPINQCWNFNSTKFVCFLCGKKFKIKK